MKDLRQAVIDAIHGLRIMGVSEKERIYNQALRNAEAVVLGLPFAQPEIIRCGECTHKDKKIDYCHCLGITICERDFCSFAERRTDDEG